MPYKRRFVKMFKGVNIKHFQKILLSYCCNSLAGLSLGLLNRVKLKDNFKMKFGPIYQSENKRDVKILK